MQYLWANSWLFIQLICFAAVKRKMLSITSMLKWIFIHLKMVDGKKVGKINFKKFLFLFVGGKKRIFTKRVNKTGKIHFSVLCFCLSARSKTFLAHSFNLEKMFFLLLGVMVFAVSRVNAFVFFLSVLFKAELRFWV